VGYAKAASDAAVVYSADTVVVKAVASEKEKSRQEHELDMTEYAVGAAAAVDQVLGTMSIVDMPGCPASKVGLEYMQDE
jgi:hypothetical protein